MSNIDITNNCVLPNKNFNRNRVLVEFGLEEIHEELKF